jgi:hypothetical protein
MGWTREDFCTSAFEEIGLASYFFDLLPEEKQAVGKRLDAMMATWNAKGIRIGYPMNSTSDGGDLSVETNVPDSATEAIFLNLAVRIAPKHGKVVSLETKQMAYEAYQSLILRYMAKPGEMQLPSTLPSGAGNKPFRVTDRKFLDTPTDPILAGDDSVLEF